MVHSGSMGGGHYVAYVRTSPTGSEWYHISDTSVGSVSQEEALSQQAYILFYERRDVRG